MLSKKSVLWLAILVALLLVGYAGVRYDQQKKANLSCPEYYNKYKICPEDRCVMTGAFSEEVDGFAIDYLPSCQVRNEDFVSGASPFRERITLFVNSSLVDCTGVGPQKCMQVRRGGQTDWYLFYSNRRF